MCSPDLTQAQQIVLTDAIKKLEHAYEHLAAMKMPGLSPGMTLHALLTGIVSKAEGDGIQLHMIDALKRLNPEVFDWENDPIPDPE